MARDLAHPPAFLRRDGRLVMRRTRTPLRSEHGAALGDAQATREIPPAVRLGRRRESRIVLRRVARESRQPARERERERAEHNVAEFVLAASSSPLFDCGRAPAGMPGCRCPRLASFGASAGMSMSCGIVTKASGSGSASLTATLPDGATNASHAARFSSQSSRVHETGTSAAATEHASTMASHSSVAGVGSNDDAEWPQLGRTNPYCNSISASERSAS